MARKKTIRGALPTGANWLRGKGLVTIQVPLPEDQRRAVQAVASLDGVASGEFLRLLALKDKRVITILGKN